MLFAVLNDGSSVAQAVFNVDFFIAAEFVSQIALIGFQQSGAMSDIVVLN